MAFERIVLIYVAKPEDEDPEGWDITVDLTLDENRMPVVAGPVFGARGGLTKTAKRVAPFVLHADGTLDWGSDWEDDRWSEFNLISAARPVVVGEVFTLTLEGGGEDVYRVARSVELH